MNKLLLTTFLILTLAVFAPAAFSGKKSWNSLAPADKQALAQHALGRKLTLYDRSLDMHVSNLRRKLGPHADGSPRIVALRSRGYLYAV